MTESKVAETRCVALVGPYGSGKTTLMGHLLATAGRHVRPNGGGNGIDGAEIAVGETSYLGDSWAFLDCPGSIEFSQEALNALMIADGAVVVCEPELDKIQSVGPVLKFLDDHGVPCILFINKVDHLTAPVGDLLAAVQESSPKPAVLRQIPLREDGENEAVTGYVDLVSERAYHYKPGEASGLIPLPSEAGENEQTARQDMLESLADFDDGLLEKLLEDIAPEKSEIYRHLAEDLRRGLIMPVLLGSAGNNHGILRLLKLLRHEIPAPTAAAERFGLNGADGGAPVMTIFKTLHQPHVGKLSYARLWQGKASEGMQLHGHRLGGLYRVSGHDFEKQAEAGPGDIIALGRVEDAQTGEMLIPGDNGRGEELNAGLDWPTLGPVYAFTIEAKNRSDEVKLTDALHRLVEEDRSLKLDMDADSGQILLYGQGEMHLRAAAAKLEKRYNLAVETGRPQTPYKETIRKSTSRHSRYKRQTGGHGQFGDVHIDIKPLPRGSGFQFDNSVVGGAVPRQFIPAVETGVREYLPRGPLGFPIVDISVTLTDGQHHAVDSSEQSFKIAGRLAMSEGMPDCGPVLLEPVMKVTIATPQAYTPKVQRVVTGRRGQLLGFDARAGWSGWDEIYAHMPQAEIHDLIVELRSLSSGLATYSAEFDHLAEITGRLADDIVRARAAELEQ